MKVLDLYITKVCNLDCEYCYVEVVKKEGEVFSPGNFMEKVNLLEYNSIKFLGGEPLIRWKQIQEIVDAVKAKNKKIQFTIVTNGVLIDAKKIPYILENNIEVLVSIHEGSFPFLKKNYTLLQKIRDNICFYIIFDPTNFSTAFRNFLFFFQREFWNFSFAPEIYGDWNDENVKKFKKILDILLPYIKKNNINIS